MEVSGLTEVHRPVSQDQSRLTDWLHRNIGHLKLWEYRNMEMWKYAHMEIYANTEIRKYGNMEIRLMDCLPELLNKLCRTSSEVCWGSTTIDYKRRDVRVAIAVEQRRRSAHACDGAQADDRARACSRSSISHGSSTLGSTGCLCTPACSPVGMVHRGHVQLARARLSEGALLASAARRGMHASCLEGIVASGQL